MGSLYRSEQMSLCQLFLQNDSAFECVAQLGELALCQFRDLNADVSPHQRKFMQDVKRCDEMDRKLRFFQNELNIHDISIPQPAGTVATPLPRDMIDLEAKFEKLEEELKSINESTEVLRANYLHLTDMKHILVRIRTLLQEGERSRALQSISEVEQGFGGPIEVHAAKNGYTNYGMTNNSTPELTKDVERTKEVPSEIKITAGVVSSAHVLAFERVLWRMCHGKVYMRTADIEEESNVLFKSDHKKSAFLLFHSGTQLQNKIKKICEAFYANILENLSDSAIGRAEILRTISQRLEDMNMVIGKTFEHHSRVLNAAALNIKVWEIQVIKLKSIFHTLNMFNLDITQKCLIAECWLPTRNISHVRTALYQATELSGSNVASILHTLDIGHETPPTYNAVNKFTSAFQNIVNSYGIANYQEINPAPWTIITFPFLFAVMFGDSGHGVIMFLAALALVLFEKKIEAAKIREEIFNTFYGGRYVILLMGAFSIYTGLIYNDIFSKSINLFGSSWRNPYKISELEKMMNADKSSSNKMSLELSPEFAFDHERGPYVMGLDPVWNLALNRLNFLNPMKMKLSILVGVSQMFFGVVLSYLNYSHKNSKVDILFVFIPQMLFLSLIFVYLCIQVVIKWLFFWVKPGFVLGQYYPGSHCAPSLLIGLINMFMFKDRQQGFVYDANTARNDCSGNLTDCVENDQCYLQLWYPYQDKVEAIFILVAVICIPVMLLVKPLILWSRVRRGEVVDTGHGDGEFSMGDVMVYQAIHTIEFALGCISHTASYLRLWALSLAHAQLSDVLWTMMLRHGLVMRGNVGVAGQAAAFLFFGVLSIMIFVLMEGLSAFLHALRLHWVEFQSKFYGGTGIAFEPLSFAKEIRIYEGFDS